MLIVLAAFLIASGITFISIPAIINLAKQKRLFDEPDLARKLHHPRIPTLGGVAIFGGFLISSIFWFDYTQDPALPYAFASMAILFFTGIKDDIIPLTARKKFVAQLIAVAIVVFRADIRLTNLYGLAGLEEISYPLSVALTSIALLGLINAFNLIDGINGLAGGIAFIVGTIFGLLFLNMQALNLAILSFAMAGACVGFLYYNYQNRIFMGDTGSLTIGLISAILAIEFIEINASAQGYLFKSSFAPVFALAVLIIPFFDTVRVMVLRIAQGNSPFEGDRNHLHHLLVDSGLTHIQAAATLYFTNLLFVGMAWLGQSLPQLLLLFCLLSSATALSMLLYYFKMQRELAKSDLLSHNAALSGFKKYREQALSSK
ncbi:MAG: undecaprenyl/decaprenyl-phosphate alpha-N-acetylglucosaminyl 1-phosphate transferase [Microscillaceae bacterium]|nr:undecaprenyl/decaprenyl-phosphate alpha-N-acetylglucosaminyl 1-phosphate transferase [Microscillaceae bacterium]